MRSNRIKLLITGILVTLSVQAVGKLRSNDTLSKEWGIEIDRNLDSLPTEGSIDEKRLPWAEARFEARTGSILNRYQQDDLDGAEKWTRRPMTLAEIKRIPEAKRGKVLSRVSAAELFDITRGFYHTYPLTQEIRRSLARAKSPAQIEAFDEKMNFGWAVAATQMAEPDRIEDYPLRFPDDGKTATLEIGSSEIKGLISYYYGVKVAKKVKLVKVGSRCHGEGDRDCKRIDPISFHLLITHTIRRSERSFIVDIDPSERVDYRPILRYESKIARDEFNPRRYEIETRVDYAKRRAPFAGPYSFFNLDADSETYRYALEVDSDGHIQAGDWLSIRRPEFIFRVKSLPHVDHEGFGILKSFYREAPILSE